MIEVIEPSVEVIEAPSALKKLELCGRICYKSEDKICEGSAERMLGFIIKRGHTSVLEHYQIAVESTEKDLWESVGGIAPFVNDIDWEAPEDDKSSCCRNFLERIDEKTVVGNVRAWRNWLEKIPEASDFIPSFQARYPVLFDHIDAEYNNFQPGPAPINIKEASNYITLRVICDRGVTHEIVRHRILSFSQESTRYCNYSNKPMQFIKPIPFRWTIGGSAYDAWFKSCQQSADAYLEMLKFGCTPQEARTVLNNSLKTEIAITGRIWQWKRFLKLRLPADAHPQMRLIAIKILDILKERFPNENFGSC